MRNIFLTTLLCSVLSSPAVVAENSLQKKDKDTPCGCFPNPLTTYRKYRKRRALKNQVPAISTHIQALKQAGEKIAQRKYFSLYHSDTGVVKTLEGVHSFFLQKMVENPVKEGGFFTYNQHKTVEAKNADILATLATEFIQAIPEKVLADGGAARHERAQFDFIYNFLALHDKKEAAQTVFNAWLKLRNARTAYGDGSVAYGEHTDFCDLAHIGALKEESDENKRLLAHSFGTMLWAADEADRNTYIKDGGGISYMLRLLEMGEVTQATKWLQQFKDIAPKAHQYQIWISQYSGLQVALDFIQNKDTLTSTLRERLLTFVLHDYCSEMGFTQDEIVSNLYKDWFVKKAFLQENAAVFTQFFNTKLSDDKAQKMIFWLNDHLTDVPDKFYAIDRLLRHTKSNIGIAQDRRIDWNVLKERVESAAPNQVNGILLAEYCLVLAENARKNLNRQAMHDYLKEAEILITPLHENAEQAYESLTEECQKFLRKDYEASATLPSEQIFDYLNRPIDDIIKEKKQAQMEAQMDEMAEQMVAQMVVMKALQEQIIALQEQEPAPVT